MILALVVCLLISIYLYATSTHGYWSNRGIKYVKPLPIIGNMLEVFTFRKTTTQFFQDIYVAFEDDYIGMWSFRRPALIVKNPEAIKAVLVKDFSSFRDRSTVTNPHKDPVGSKNLLFIKDPVWKPLRVKMTPFFTSSRMKSMFDLVSRVGGDLVDYIGEEIDQKRSLMEAKNLCSHFTTDAIAAIAFGVEGNSFKDPNSVIRKLSERIFDFDLRRAAELTSLFLAPDVAKIFNFHVFNSKCSKAMVDLFCKILEERERSRIERSDFVSMLNGLKDQNIDQDGIYKFDINTLVGQAATFFTAGFETSSSAISFTLYEMAKSPEIQEKLSKEIDEVLDEHSGVISYDSVQKMHYLDMCLKETLRKYPPLPFLDRECTRTYRIPEKNATIDPGTIVYIPAYSVHMDPNHFPEPDVYDPERFSAANVANVKPFTYMPFGLGPRTCIGERLGIMNSKIGLVHILKNFSVRKCEGTEEKITFNPRSILITSLNGIYLEFVKK